MNKIIFSYESELDQIFHDMTTGWALPVFTYVHGPVNHDSYQWAIMNKCDKYLLKLGEYHANRLDLQG